MAKRITNILMKGISSVDLPLLLFLASIIHVKLYTKLAAVILYAGYLLYKRYSFPKKLTGPMWFYLMVIPLGLTASLFNDSLNQVSYWRGFGIGAFKWMTAGAVFYLLMLVRQHITPARLITTIQAFFLANAVVSAFDLGSVMADSQRWIPYWINDRPEYGISTGDYIRGLSRDNSITNAAINVMGVLFFLFRKKPGWALLCLVIAILCTSNFSMILLLLCLAVTIFLIRDRKVKLYAGAFILCSVLLYILLSMQNVSYSNNTLQKEITNISSQSSPATFSLRAGHNPEMSDEEIEASEDESGNIIHDLQKIQAYIVTEGSGRLDTGTARYAIKTWYNVPYNQSELAISGMPGKLYALMQAGSYMTSGIRPLLLGAGTGNFASNLAIKMTGLKIHGDYPSQYIYAHNDFINYHLYIWLYAYAHTAEFQSVTQLPANVYSQLGGEYGLIGLGLFAFCYVFYFLKRNRFRVEALIITGMLLGYFFVDYWFEMISLTVVFELIMISGQTRVKSKDK